MIFKLIPGLFVLLALVIGGYAVSGYYKAALPQSYLPDNKSGSNGGFRPDTGMTTINNPWYNLFIDSSGNLKVRTKDNDLVV